MSVNFSNSLNTSGNIYIDGTSLLDLKYPIGSIFTTTSTSTPETILGFGTWEQIPEDTMLFASSWDNFPVGSSGGANASQVASHTHSIPSFTSNTGGAHAHGASGSYYYRGTDKASQKQSGTGNYTQTTATYTISVSTYTATHAHTISNTVAANTTTATANGNIPPCRQVAIWKRTA